MNIMGAGTQNKHASLTYRSDYDTQQHWPQQTDRTNEHDTQDKKTK